MLSGSSYSRILFTTVILTFIILLSSGCSQDSGYGSNNSPIKEGTLPPTQNSLAPTRAEWTFLVYMCSDNNLEYCGYLDLKEMEGVGSTDKVNVIVQWDRAGNDPSQGWQGCRRFFINRSDEWNNEIASTQVQDLGPTNMGAPDTLVDFVKWGIETFPAEKYAVILWDHGGGWRASGPRGNLLRGICWDDSSDDHMTTIELAQAFSRIHDETGAKIELVGMDACLMASVELAYELKNYANFAVFSEGIEPGGGWPFNAILRDLCSKPEMDGGDLGRYIVLRYSQAYGVYDKLTQSSVDLSGMDDLVEALKNFSDYASALPDEQLFAIVNCLDRSQKIDKNYPDFVDLGSFLDEISAPTSGVSDGRVKDLAQEIKNALGRAVIAEFHTAKYNSCSGLTIWLPNYYQYWAYYDKYADLWLAKGTKWDELLEKIANCYFL